MKPHHALSAFAALIAQPWCAAAHAQVFAIESIPASDTGRVVSAPGGVMVLRANADGGNVSVVSGGGVIVGATSARALVTVRCRESKLCQTNRPLVIINAGGTPSGRAGQLTNFSVSTSGATATITAPPAPASTIKFLLEPLGFDTPRSFWVGFDMPIQGDDSGKPSGRATSSFVVTIMSEGGPSASAMDGAVTVTALRGVSLAKIGDLAFGRIVRSNDGKGLVRLDPGTGVVQVEGSGIVALGGSATHPASFRISGEAGQSVSMFVPDSFEMKGAAESIKVKTIASLAGDGVLPGIPGNAGNLQLNVGGEFELHGKLPGGTYTGSFVVSVSYN